MLSCNEHAWLSCWQHSQDRHVCSFKRLVASAPRRLTPARKSAPAAVQRNASAAAANDVPIYFAPDPAPNFQTHALDAVFDETAPRVIVDLLLERAARDPDLLEELERLEGIAERGGMVPADGDAENGNQGLRGAAAPSKARAAKTHASRGSSDLTRNQFLRRHAALCALVSRKDASRDQQHQDLIRHFKEAVIQDETDLTEVSSQLPD